MSAQQTAQLAVLLRELERALRSAAQWDGAPPDPVALDSIEPFCVDTLSLPQWLQWIFLPRMQALLDARGALPSRCGIAAMAEVYYRGRADGATLRLLEVLREIDAAVEAAAS